MNKLMLGLLAILISAFSFGKTIYAKESQNNSKVLCSLKHAHDDDEYLTPEEEYREGETFLGGD